jgi:tetratricopeptide (TPR) repeat protein
VIDEAASQMSLDPGTARRMLDHLLFEGGPNARALALRSQVDLALGDKPSALSDANQAVALNARLPQAYEARAKAKQALGQPRADVLADLQTASELDPQLTGEYQAALAGHFGPQEAPAASAPASFGADRWLLGWLPASLQEKLSRGGAAGLIAAVAALVLAWLLLIFWPRKKAGEDLN